jgi:hypothetical protein
MTTDYPNNYCPVKDQENLHSGMPYGACVCGAPSEVAKTTYAKRLAYEIDGYPCRYHSLEENLSDLGKHMKIVAKKGADERESGHKCFQCSPLGKQF